MNTLRKKMGKIVVGFVAFSMVAFILTDFFQSNSTLLGGNDNTIAEINGNSIAYPAYQAKFDELAYVFALNQGRNPSAQENETIREQTWNALVLENAYAEQFKALGIEVTDAEVVDMVQGNNISPQIQQFFTDPNTGEFSRDNVISFLQQINGAPAQQRQSWLSFENRLRPNRTIQKYDNLFDLSIYATKAEAQAKYVAQSSNMSADFLYVPYFSVSDSQFTVSDSEMERYLNDHSEEFQREESRNLNYVIFPIQPSSSDTAFVYDEVVKLKAGLAKAKNDSIYATLNTEGLTPFKSITDPSLVPVELVDAEVGTVTDPTLVGNNYAISKLTAITTGSEYFVKASHILIESDGTGSEAKSAALRTANEVLRQLRNGGDFTALAAQYSTDQSNANNGGDLGWFGENGNFVQPFKDAAFGKKGTGLITKSVETSFGYHIIRIDEPKTNKVYKVATIEKEIFASDVTLNETYRQADLLATNSDDAKGLAALAAENGMDVKTASNIGKNDSRVGVVTDARSIVLWLYNTASVGDVSTVFELNNNYVVAGMTGMQEKGTAKLSQVKSEVKTKVLNEKKSAAITEKLMSANSDDFAAIKEAYGPEARTGTSDLNLNSNSFPSVGFAPEAVGVAFSLEEGESTKPFTITNGVVMVKAVSKSMAEELTDYSPYIAQVESERRSRKTVVANFPLSFYPVFVSQSVDNAIKEFSQIEDLRYKFF